MSYYQILKQRRLDLNLSIQDLAIQTRLKPEYIRAIEENNLDIFSDDFSYVRYFVHGYCDAIGVNWNLIKDEVDANINAYAAARDQALYQAQVKMIQSMPSVTTAKKTTRANRKKRKRRSLLSSAGKLSRSISWGNQNRLSRLILVCAICVVGGLALVSYVGQQRAAKSLEQQKIARANELKAEEETTQRLAEDRKSRQDDSSTPVQTTLQIAPTSTKGVYDINGFNPANSTIHIDITPGNEQTVTILWNDTPAFSSQVKSLFVYDLNAKEDGTITLIFANEQAQSKVKIDDLEIPAEYLKAQSGHELKIQFNVHFNGPLNGESETASNEAAQHAASSEQGSDPDTEPVVPVEDYTDSVYEDPGYADPNDGYQYPAAGGSDYTDSVYTDPGYDPGYTDPVLPDPGYTDPVVPDPGTSDFPMPDLGEDVYVDADGNPITW